MEGFITINSRTCSSSIYTSIPSGIEELCWDNETLQLSQWWNLMIERGRWSIDVKLEYMSMKVNDPAYWREIIILHSHMLSTPTMLSFRVILIPCVTYMYSNYQLHSHTSWNKKYVWFECFMNHDTILLSIYPWVKILQYNEMLKEVCMMKFSTDMRYNIQLLLYLSVVDDNKMCVQVINLP